MGSRLRSFKSRLAGLFTRRSKQIETASFPTLANGDFLVTQDTATHLTHLKWIGSFSDQLEISISREAYTAICNGRLRVQLKGMKGRAGAASKLRLGAMRGNLSISVGKSNVDVWIGDKVRGQFQLVCHDNSTVKIGDRSSATGLILYAKRSEFSCGVDCMFSSEVILQTSDQHGIVDLETGAFTQADYAETHVGDHVWIGRRVTLLPGSRIGSGSVVGTCAVVPGSIPENSVAVGVPARVVRENVSWSRYMESLDPGSRDYIARQGVDWLSEE